MKKYLHFLLCAMLLCFYLYIYFTQTVLVSIDSCRWITVGLQLVDGNLDTYFFEGGAPPYSPLVYAPGYPVLIALLNLIVHDPVASAHLVSIISGTLLCLVVFYLAKELFNRDIAILSLIFCGLQGSMVKYATLARTRSSSMLFLLLGIYLFVLIPKKKSFLLPLFSGLAIGIAILVRIEFGLYAILLGSWLAVGIWKNKFKVSDLLWFSFAVAFVYSIYAYPLYKYTGFKLLPPIITNNIFSPRVPPKPYPNKQVYKIMDTRVRTVLFNNNTASRLNLIHQKKVKVSQEDWERYKPLNKKKETKLSMDKYKGLFLKIIPGVLGKFWIFFVLGCCYCGVHKHRKSLFLFFIILLTFIVYSPVSTFFVRYFSHLRPLTLIISACGLYFLADIFRERVNIKKQLLYLFIILGLILVFTTKEIKQIKRGYTPQEKAWLQSAEFFKKNAEAQSVVVARRRYPSFYGGMRFTVLPDEKLADTMAYANFINAGYLIIDTSTAILMPQYQSLLNSPPPPGLTLCKELFPGTEAHTRIFRFLFNRS